MANLKDKIVEWNGRDHGAMSNFANEVGIERTTLYRKITGSRGIKREEVFLWSEILGIKYKDINKYFGDSVDISST